MALGGPQQAKRALVKLVLTFAGLYSVQVCVSRDSTDEELLKACKRVLLKVHPDKGGRTEHSQELNAAKDSFESARKAGGQKRGRKQKSDATEVVKTTAGGAKKEGKRVNSLGVLLTYNGIADLKQWGRFLAHVRSHLVQWKVHYWCATLEATKGGKLHIHLFLQFRSLVDRDSKSFSFEGSHPRADTNDLLGEGFSRRKLQESLDRAFFYCWADKKGTQRDEQGKECTEGNYFPCWTEESFTYAVKGRWPENLWKAHKLSHEVYENYLFSCRDGVLYRKRNLDACREWAEGLALEEELEARTKRLRGNPDLFKPFPHVPAAQAWLKCFQKDMLRYPLLVVLGKSLTGKTEWAQSLFKQPLVLKVGTLEHFPAGMRAFKKGYHDGVVLDDLRDLYFLVRHQEKVQGKYNAAVEFASTPGGHLAYCRDLFAVPVVATVNYTTQNLNLLEDDDFLANPGNRVLLHFPPPN